MSERLKTQQTQATRHKNQKKNYIYISKKHENKTEKIPGKAQILFTSFLCYLSNESQKTKPLNLLWVGFRNLFSASQSPKKHVCESPGIMYTSFIFIYIYNVSSLIYYLLYKICSCSEIKFGSRLPLYF